MEKKIKFKRLSENAIMPKKATEGSIAFDVYVPKDTIIENGRNLVPLDFAIELPAGYEAKIEPRSGFSLKGMEGYQIMKTSVWIEEDEKVNVSKWDNWASLDPSRFDADVLVGKIDADYRGNVGVIINSHEPTDFMIKAGTRIAQLTIYHSAPDWEFMEVDELSDTERKDGGFGHSGTK